MGKGFTGAILTVMGVKSHIATTTGKTVINDRMVTIHFHSETLLNTEGEVPGDWLRLWFPHESRPGKLYQRAYTLTNVDADAGTFDLAFVLHEPLGPASAWATRCEAGESLEVMRYPGIPFAIPDPAPRGFLFLGDLTSYPAICSILETLDGEIPVTAYLIAHDPLDYTFDFPQGEHITAQWISNEQSFIDHIADTDYTDFYTWIGAESSETRAAKKHLQTHTGMPKTHMNAQGYWNKGRAMGKSN